MVQNYHIRYFCDPYIFSEVDKIKRTKIRQLLDDGKVGFEICVKGWVRTKRASKNVAFVALNDGSGIRNIQIVLDAEKFDEDFVRKINTGTSLSAIGNLVESQGAGQSVELVADQIEILGEADPEQFPLQPKKTFAGVLKRNCSPATKN